MRPLTKLETLTTEIRQNIAKMGIFDVARCDGVAYLNFRAAETLVQVSQTMYDDVLTLVKLELAASEMETEDSGDSAPWGCHQKIEPSDIPCDYHFNYEPDEDYRQTLKEFIFTLEQHKNMRMETGQSFDFMIMNLRKVFRGRERGYVIENCDAHRLAAMKVEHKLYESQNVGESAPGLARL